MDASDLQYRTSNLPTVCNTYTVLSATWTMDGGSSYSSEGRHPDALQGVFRKSEYW